ncbi:MAG TPA: aminotransferase class III-fold pyridoxal phosphate-dependent enzyme [Actinomycetota bacterium]|jgi:adenosylmethionine-8-amino-7-oxononanoate aminotransferase|nr:aminotransferase class III-fold pyridoxal phosphate-dependent enzyme [Actinomycetota bacterium]
MGRFWHPFADMAATETEGELVIERGEGVHVWDEGGRRYLDATAALWYCNVGYGREEIAAAAGAQLRKLPAYSAFGDLATRPAIELAERVAAIAPVADSRVFLTSGGSDSIDTAAKIARRYWQLEGQTDRTLFVTRERAYHGMHIAGTSLAGIDANASGYGALVGDVVRVAWDSPQELRDAIAFAGPERVAAFFCEPIIGAGGVFAPPQGYLDEVRQICRETGVLFVADEVITGFGRVGEWFASTRWDLQPDLMTCAKGITSGYLPMGAVVASPRVADAFWRPGAGMFRHGYTYSGHAAVAAAALANLQILEREGLPKRALQLEGDLAGALAPLLEHPLVEEIRSGTGVVAAVQLSTGAIRDDPALPAKAVAACRDAGIMTRALGTGAMQVSPALVIDGAELVELQEGLSAALDEVA